MVGAGASTSSVAKGPGDDRPDESNLTRRVSMFKVEGARYQSDVFPDRQRRCGPGRALRTQTPNTPAAVLHPPPIFPGVRRGRNAPTPMMGHVPLVCSCTARIIAVLRSLSGAPERPPASAKNSAWQDALGRPSARSCWSAPRHPHLQPEQHPPCEAGRPRQGPVRI